MKAGLLPLALGTGVLIAAGVLVAVLVGANDGGGGGDTSTLEGYFRTLNTVQTGISTEYGALSSQYPEAFSDLEQAESYLDESQGIWTDGADSLKEIEPPSEAEQVHTDLIQATEGVGGAFGGLLTGAQGLDDSAGLEDLFMNADQTAFDDYRTACTALQNLAGQNSITDETGAAIVLVC